MNAPATIEVLRLDMHDLDPAPENGEDGDRDGAFDSSGE